MPNSIMLADGSAEMMGDRVALVIQDSDEGPQNVVLTVADLKAMLVALEG